MDALNEKGLKAKLLVRDKQTDHISVVPLRRSRKLVAKFIWERVVIWRANHFKKHNLFAVDIANTGTDITSLPEFKQADVVHLHWINQGMLSLRNIEKMLAWGKPMVWTMHDMWPCTGICHHARECTHYQTECHHCPFLYGGGGANDLSRRTFLKKKKLLEGRRITFVACSHWLEERAKQSALLKGQTVVSIPNPLNTNFFKPHDKREARAKCHLPQQGQLMLFGSVKPTDKRKGIDYLIESCRLLAERYPELKEQLGVVVLGRQARLLEHLLPFKVYPFEFMLDRQQLVNLYNAVDLFVTPSLEENLPNTIMEAMACGVPCVGFQTGGIPEMIDHLHNGYVADYRSADDFANGIHWLLTDADYALRSEEARRKVVSHYSEQVVGKRYIDLYNRITGRHA
jgi:glycosyltransferase involved in cell wall biosynthesis